MPDSRDFEIRIKTLADMGGITDLAKGTNDAAAAVEKLGTASSNAGSNDKLDKLIASTRADMFELAKVTPQAAKEMHDLLKVFEDVIGPADKVAEEMHKLNSPEGLKGLSDELGQVTAKGRETSAWTKTWSEELREVEARIKGTDTSLREAALASEAAAKASAGMGNQFHIDRRHALALSAAMSGLGSSAAEGEVGISSLHHAVSAMAFVMSTGGPMGMAVGMAMMGVGALIEHFHKLTQAAEKANKTKLDDLAKHAGEVQEALAKINEHHNGLVEDVEKVTKAYERQLTVLKQIFEEHQHQREREGKTGNSDIDLAQEWIEDSDMSKPDKLVAKQTLEKERRKEAHEREQSELQERAATAQKEKERIAEEGRQAQIRSREQEQRASDAEKRDLALHERGVAGSKVAAVKATISRVADDFLAAAKEAKVKGYADAPEPSKEDAMREAEALHKDRLDEAESARAEADAKVRSFDAKYTDKPLRHAPDEQEALKAAHKQWEDAQAKNPKEIDRLQKEKDEALRKATEEGNDFIRKEEIQGHRDDREVKKAKEEEADKAFKEATKETKDETKAAKGDLKEEAGSLKEEVKEVHEQAKKGNKEIQDDLKGIVARQKSFHTEQGNEAARMGQELMQLAKNNPSHEEMKRILDYMQRAQKSTDEMTQQLARQGEAATRATEALNTTSRNLEARLKAVEEQQRAMR